MNDKFRNRIFVKNPISMLIIAALIVSMAASIAPNAAAAPAFAPVYDIQLTVTVTDCYTAQPIQGATVNVLTAAVDRGSQNLATTNAGGVAVIYPLRVGDRQHTVQVSAPGYRTVQKIAYMTAWSEVPLNICLETLAGPPTETPTPTATATITPTVVSTVDESKVGRCTTHLSEGLKALVAPVDSALVTEGIEPVVRCMMQCAAQTGKVPPAAEEPAVGIVSPGEGVSAPLYRDYYACFQSCADFGYFERAARAIAGNTTSPARLIAALADLLSASEGTASCGDAGAFVFQLVKQLAIYDAQVNLVALHSPANVWVSDPNGKKTGFLEDGSVIEEIPDARAVRSGESEYILIPATPDMQVELKSTAKGKITLELVYTKNDAVVQEIAYEDVLVESETKGNINLGPAQPPLELDTPGLGTRSEPPSRFEEMPVIPLPTPTLAPTSSPTAPDSSPQPTATATLKPGILEKLSFDEQPLKIAGIAAAACCAGLLLALALIGVAVWLRRRSRRGTGVVDVAPAGKECPRCGAHCQSDARFCYKCGLSFVQPAAPPRPAATPARPVSPPPAPPAAPIACTKCGQPLRATSKFCPKCGQATGR